MFVVLTGITRVSTRVEVAVAFECVRAGDVGGDYFHSGQEAGVNIVEKVGGFERFDFSRAIDRPRE